MVVLITGGSRSGKSRFARELAEGFSCRRIFVATCAPVDEEMRSRIRSHRRERVDQMWETVEEELDLQGVLRAQPSQDLILVDCLTLWVNNLMYQAEQKGREIGEDDIQKERLPTDNLSARSKEIICRKCGVSIFAITNIGAIANLRIHIKEHHQQMDDSL